MVLLFTTCEDRPHINPFDPETGPDAWTPSNLQAEVINDSQIKLTWTREYDQISGFRLERKENSESFTQIAELEANVTEYTDTDLTLGTDYVYRVKAFTEIYESDYATSNTTTMSIPHPTNLTATPLNDTDIQLIWNDNCSFESGFRLERSDGGSYTQIAEVGENITEYANTGLTLGTDYTYRVKAFTDVNESDFAETTVNFWYDCNQEWGGTAIEDCNGDCGGTAIENECGCVGGNTGLEEEFCHGTVTDVDGNIYQTMIIGSQEWMIQNLKVSHYRNGTAISTGHSDSDWQSLSTGAYEVYNNDPENAEIYGNLYNWYAVDDSRNIAPIGWHVPTDDEIKQLEMHLGMSQSQADSIGYRGTNEGSKLAGDADLWWGSGGLEDKSEFGSSGFDALPGGYRNGYHGGFQNKAFDGYFWSSTEYSTGSNNPLYRHLHFNYTAVSRGFETVNWDSYSTWGFSVRCVKD
jgi:uncharacterized protein (TIGR02145 family)